MKLRAELAGQQFDLRLRTEGDRTFFQIDDRQYEVNVRQTDQGALLLIHDCDVYECHIERAHRSAGPFEVAVGNASFTVGIIDPKRLRTAFNAGAHAHGAAEIIAPMPGKIVRVLVEAGADIEAGAGVVVVEAMKMQNEMKSPKRGKIVAINALAGATVNAGDVLAVIE